MSELPTFCRMELDDEFGEPYYESVGRFTRSLWCKTHGDVVMAHLPGSVDGEPECRWHLKVDATKPCLFVARWMEAV